MDIFRTEGGGLGGYGKCPEKRDFLFLEGFPYIGILISALRQLPKSTDPALLPPCNDKK